MGKKKTVKVKGNKHFAEKYKGKRIKYGYILLKINRLMYSKKTCSY